MPENRLRASLTRRLAQIVGEIAALGEVPARAIQEIVDCGFVRLVLTACPPGTGHYGGLPPIVARFDAELRHVYVSREIEEITGLPASHFIGKTNRELGMPVHLVDQWETAFRHVFRTAIPTAIQFDFTSRTGKVLRFESHIVPECDQDGIVTGLASIVREIATPRHNHCAARPLPVEPVSAPVPAAPTAPPQPVSASETTEWREHHFRLFEAASESTWEKSRTIARRANYKSAHGTVRQGLADLVRWGKLERNGAFLRKKPSV